MKTLVLLLITISCLQTRESVCKRDSSLCEDKKNDGNPFDNDDSFGNDPYNPWDGGYPGTPIGPGDMGGTEGPTITDPEDPTGGTDPATTDPGNTEQPTITVNELSPDTKLTDITIEGSCAQAGCIHAETGKNFELKCSINLPCHAPFKPNIKTKGTKGTSATPLCSSGNTKVSEIRGSRGHGRPELKCSFDNDAWVNLLPKSSNIILNATIIANKYICVHNSRQGNDLFIAVRSGLCNQTETALQIEFKW